MPPVRLEGEPLGLPEGLAGPVRAGLSPRHRSGPEGSIRQNGRGHSGRRQLGGRIAYA